MWFGRVSVGPESHISQVWNSLVIYKQVQRERWQIEHKKPLRFISSPQQPGAPATVFMTHHTEWTAKWARFSVQEVFNHFFHILTHEKWFSKFFLMLELIQKELTKLTSPESFKWMCIWAPTLYICFWFIYTELIKGLCHEGFLMFENTWGFLNGILYFPSPFFFFWVSQTLMWVNKLGPLRIWGLLLYLKWRGSSWQLADKASLALGAHWHQSPRGSKGKGEQGNSLQKTFFYFVVESFSFNSQPQSWSKIQSWKVAEGSLWPAWGGGVQMFLLHSVSFLRERSDQSFSGTRCVFTWTHHFLRWCVEETGQESLATAED